MEGAVDTIRSATKGDYVVWENRTWPLKVFSTSTDEDGNYQISVVGANNGRLSITENFAPDGSPAPKSNTNETIRGLRFATDEEVEEGWGEEAAEKVTNGRSPRGRTEPQPGPNVPDDNPEGSGRDMQRFETDGGPGMVVPEEYVEEQSGGGYTLADSTTALAEDDGAPRADGEEFDGTGDEYAKERLDDPFAEFDDLLQAMNADPRFDDAETYFQRDEETTHTWVDELVAFGQDIPRVAAGWILIDYGIVDTPGRRKLAWVNQDTDELLALTAHRPEDGGPMTYNVFQEDLADARDDTDIYPAVTTNDPTEALDDVRDRIYGDLRNVEIEFLEQRDGEMRVRSDINEASLGTRFMQALGVDVRVPSAQQAKQTLFDTIRPGLNWASNNTEAIGSAILFSVEAAIAAATKRFFGAEVRPIIEPDEIGVEVNGAYRYEGKKADFVNVDAAIASTQNDGGARLSFDPGAFDLAENNRLPEALNMQFIAGISDRLNLSNVSLNVGDTDGSTSYKTSPNRRNRYRSSGSGENFDPRDDSDDEISNIAARIAPSGDKLRDLHETHDVSSVPEMAEAVVAAGKREFGLSPLTDAKFETELQDAGDQSRRMDIIEDQALLWGAYRTMVLREFEDREKNLNLDTAQAVLQQYISQTEDTIDRFGEVPTPTDFDREAFVENLQTLVSEAGSELLAMEDDGGDDDDDGDSDGSDGDGGGGDGGGDGGGGDGQTDNAPPESAIDELTQTMRENEKASRDLISAAEREGADERIIEAAAQMSGYKPSEFLRENPSAEGGMENMEQTFTGRPGTGRSAESGTNDPDAGQSYY